MITLTYFSLKILAISILWIDGNNSLCRYTYVLQSIQLLL